MNSFYDNYQKRQEQNRQQTEKRERSFGEQMYPVAIAGNLGKFLIHAFSFSGAIILPAYGFELLFGNFWLGLIVGFISVLVFVEVPKWSTVDTIFENYYDSNGMISYGLSIFAVCLMAPSILSSTFGLPILIQRVSPDAELIDLNHIKKEHKTLSSEAFAFYSPQIEKHSNDAIQYFNSNRKKDRVTGEWRLSSSKAVKYPYNEMLKAEKETQRALNSRLDSISSGLNKALLVATTKNDATIASHNFKKENAGNIAFWVMLILELCYIGIVWGLKYYEHRSKEERTGLDQAEPKETESNSTEQSRIVSIQTESNKTEQKQPREKQAVAKERKIGFDSDQHGKVFTPKGKKKPRVKYKTENGTFAEYTRADLIRMSNRETGTLEYKKELKRLITILDNH